MQNVLAYKCFNNIPKDDSKYLQALLSQGTALFNLKLTKQAKDLFQIVLECAENPTAKVMLTTASEMLYANQRSDYNARWLEKVNTCLELGFALLARECFLMVSMDSEKYGPALVGLGKNSLLQNLREDAKFYFEAALKLNPYD